jgi:hypothetical protein
MEEAGMSGKHRARRRLRRLTAAMVLAAAMLLPASPAAAQSPWQFDQFSLVGGSRFTVTLSAPQQLPGVDPAIWPPGYRFICSTTDPVVRFRVNRLPAGDVADLGVAAFYARSGTLSFQPWGTGRSTEVVFGPPFPFFFTTPIRLIFFIPERDPANALVAPPLGLYDFLIIPFSSRPLTPLHEISLPVTTLSGKLVVREGSATECPPPTSLPAFFFRARP